MSTITVKLNISERVAALKIFNDFKGKLELLAILLEDVKPFSVQPEEWEKAKLVKTPTSDGGETWSWNNEEAGEKEITLHQESVDYLLGRIVEKSNANEFTLADVAVVSFKNKLTPTA